MADQRKGGRGGKPGAPHRGAGGRTHGTSTGNRTPRAGKGGGRDGRNRDADVSQRGSKGAAGGAARKGAPGSGGANRKGAKSGGARYRGAVDGGAVVSERKDRRGRSRPAGFEETGERLRAGRERNPAPAVRSRERVFDDAPRRGGDDWDFEPTPRAPAEPRWDPIEGDPPRGERRRDGSDAPRRGRAGAPASEGRRRDKGDAPPRRSRAGDTASEGRRRDGSDAPPRRSRAGDAADRPQHSDAAARKRGDDRAPPGRRSGDAAGAVRPRASGGRQDLHPAGEPPAATHHLARDRAHDHSRQRGDDPAAHPANHQAGSMDLAVEDAVDTGMAASSAPMARPSRKAGAAGEALPATRVETVTVSADQAGMRVDRFLEARFAGLAFSHIQRIVRKGELRVDGKRADPNTRLEAGQKVRIPPLRLGPKPPRPGSEAEEKARSFFKDHTLYEDDDVLVINKPAGLAVQGGTGTVRHVDALLDALRGDDEARLRLVHRIDKDTSGCLVIAKTRAAAVQLTGTFRTRSVRKVYWAVVVGVPKPKQGRVSTFLARDEDDKGDTRMRVARHGEKEASHAVTYYAVVETAGQKLSWLSMKPVTGRTHQLRAHAAHIGHPIIGDPKYFDKENWDLPGGLQNRLHLHARRIVLPHPRGRGVIDVSAPLPQHIQQTFAVLGFDASRYDPIEDAPED